MVATPISPPTRNPIPTLPHITWEKPPDDYLLPDDPVDNINQPLLAEALRDGLASLGLAECKDL